MGLVMNLVGVLAQEPPAGPTFSSMMPMMLAIMALFYFIMIAPQRKERQQRDQFLQSLKKNDRVVTIGGIIGTVALVSDDGKEVTLKVDDNARIRFIRDAISRRLEEPKDPAASNKSAS